MDSDPESDGGVGGYSSASPGRRGKEEDEGCCKRARSSKKDNQITFKGCINTARVSSLLEQVGHTPKTRKTKSSTSPVKNREMKKGRRGKPNAGFVEGLRHEVLVVATAGGLEEGVEEGIIH